MEIIKTERHRNPSREELQVFLGACRDAAVEDGHFKVASISLETRHLDPLAVLESIYERNEFHFYLEHQAHDFALAGAEAVVLGLFDGPDRMAAVKHWATHILDHTVAVGDLDAPGAGPHFFTGFSFEDSLSPEAPFRPASIFLPRWQVARQGHYATAVANFRVDPESDLEALTRKLWAAYEKFSTFDYRETPVPVPSRVIGSREVGPANGFVQRVDTSLAHIQRGDCGKIVIARAIDFQFDRPFRPLVTLAGLRERFRDCYAFSFENDGGQSFIGASPERLVRVADGCILTEALAGTCGRGGTAREDARLARTLLESDKDRREHSHVVRTIGRRLEALGIRATHEASPGLRVLPNVQHLHTPITGELPLGGHILDIVEALHPTPAVGGVPLDAVVGLIAELEPFERGLYAGAIGYFDAVGNGEFCVGLRAGLVNEATARLFAGAGIVAGSNAEAEWRETEMKFGALRDAISATEGTGE